MVAAARLGQKALNKATRPVRDYEHSETTESEAAGAVEAEEHPEENRTIFGVDPEATGLVVA